MPSSARKRGAQTEDNVPSPVKKPRTAKGKTIAQDDENRVETEVDIVDSTIQAEPGTSPTTKRPKAVTATKSRKKAGANNQSVETAIDETIAVTTVEVEIDEAPAASPKKPRRRIKEETVEVEEKEEHVATNRDTPRKSKKRRVKKQENEENPEGVEAEDAAPKKPKRKRKTKEEKEREAMPLAARTTGLRMFIGAHVSGAKGVHNAITNCVHVGGNAFALFLKSQRKWENPPLQDEHRDGFKANCIQHKYDATRHIVPHGSYLVNLAQEDPDKAKQAYDCFIEDLHRCEALGIKLYNFHPGRTNNAPRPAAIARIASALNRALSTTTHITPLLETMAGSPTLIGSTFADLASIISLISPQHKSRIGVCVDTCHLFAAGHDLRTPSTFAAVLRELDETVGLQYVKALHLNDSRAPLGSRRDLHANIGVGFLGLRAFWNVVNERRWEGLPMVLETPIDRKVEDGAGKEGSARDNSGKISSDDDEEPKADENEGVKAKKKKKGPIKPPKEKTFEDKSIWAREIKLLESLIGMDPEGEEFKRLEKELADQGAEERKKYQEAFDRKIVKEEKMKTKDIASFFVKDKGKGKAKADVVEDDGSPLSELSESSELSELSELSDKSDQ